MDFKRIKKFLRKLHFFLIPSHRHKYIYRNAKLFHHVGKNLGYGSRFFPDNPELISLGDNVNIAANVRLINHDTVSKMLNKKYGIKEWVNNPYEFNWYQAPILIGNNVMIGAQSLILPNVMIGDNVIIGAGSIVTKDIPSNCVAAGVPCKVIGPINKLIERRKKLENCMDIEECWSKFMKQRLSQ